MRTEWCLDSSFSAGNVRPRAPIHAFIRLARASHLLLLLFRIRMTHIMHVQSTLPLCLCPSLVYNPILLFLLGTIKRTYTPKFNTCLCIYVCVDVEYVQAMTRDRESIPHAVPGAYSRNSPDHNRFRWAQVV